MRCCFPCHRDARYDCHTQLLGDAAVCPPKPLNLIEGAYSMHPLLADHYDLSVFLSIPPDLQRQRILQRNGPELAERFFSTWMPLEQVYFDAMEIPEHCSLVLDAGALADATVYA